MPTDSDTIHTDFLTSVKRFIGKEKNRRKLMLCFKEPDSHLSSNVDVLRSTAHILVRIRAGDKQHLETFQQLIEYIVLRQFPRKVQHTILDILLHNDKYLLDDIILQLTEPQRRQLKLLSVYTSMLYFDKAKNVEKEKSAFLSTDIISDPLKLKETISALIQKYEKAETKSAYTYSALSSPFFFYNVSTHFVSNKMHKERVAAQIDKTPHYTIDLEKAAYVPCLAQALQAIQGKPLEVPTLLYQIAAIYPITDDFLDSNWHSYHEKIALCDTIGHFIKTLMKTGKNPISKFHKQLPPALADILSKLNTIHPNLDYPKVWKALLQLNRLQRLSILQQHDRYNTTNLGQSLFEICYEKGAVTFELIALIAIPDITEDTRLLCRRLGGLVQLLDDCTDVDDDVGEEILTYSADYIFAPDNQDDSIPLSARLSTMPNDSSLLIRKNTFLTLLHHGIDEVITSMRKGNCYFSQLVLNQIHTEILEKLTTCINDTANITVQATPS